MRRGDAAVDFTTTVNTATATATATATVTSLSVGATKSDPRPGDADGVGVEERGVEAHRSLWTRRSDRSVRMRSYAPLLGFFFRALERTFAGSLLALFELVVGARGLHGQARARTRSGLAWLD